jgi:hypothetical protein
MTCDARRGSARARDWFSKNFTAETFADAMRIGAPGTEAGAFWGMVVGYWEQACALLHYGLLHEDLFFETSGEFFGVWELLKPIVPEMRTQFKDPQMLANLERAAYRFEAWKERRAPGHIAAVREFMKQMRSQNAAAAQG